PLESANTCFEGGPASTRVAPCSSAAAGQLWQFVPASNGYTRLKTQAGSTSVCLEGSSGAGGVKTTECASIPAQLWRLFPASAGYYQLRNQASEPGNLCLDSSNAMVACATSASQQWALNGQASGSTPPVGEKSWTLFLNTASFRGPVAFWIADTWAAIAGG